MFRRILNWLAKNFGPATTPEEVAGLEMGKFAGWKHYSENYTPISKESLVEKMREAAKKTKWNPLPEEPLVELTATETKVEQYARLSREITCECVRHNGGTERSSELLAALNVLRLKMTLGDVSRAAMSLRKSPN